MQPGYALSLTPRAGAQWPALQPSGAKPQSTRASELGIALRRGVRFDGFEQDWDGVSVQTSAESLRAKYLVGCDGGRSRVRKLAGFEFPGTEPTITGYLAIVRRRAHALILNHAERVHRATSCAP